MHVSGAAVGVCDAGWPSVDGAALGKRRKWPPGRGFVALRRTFFVKFM